MIDEFIIAACVPRKHDHSSGKIDLAESIRAKHPEVASANVYTAAVLGDDGLVAKLVAEDSSRATAKGGPHDWDALTYLCFSNYLKVDRSTTVGFVRAARLLLDAGASANTGWFESSHLPQPEWESAIYGACGVAHHPELTRVLLEYGADPNDDETPYHTPETSDDSALTVLLDSGKLNQDSLNTLLLRKADWQHVEGIKLLLEHGADPNRITRWKYSALHQAVRRDTDLDLIESLLDHGGDPLLPNEQDGRSALSIAVRRGRGDVLAAFERRGIPMELEGVERLIAACARNNGELVWSIALREPETVRELVADGGRLLSEFAATANTDSIGHLLDLGVDIAARYTAEDGYFGIAKDSTALHVAAWRSWPETVRYLIGRGAPLDVLDGKGRTPLALAVRACVDPWWTRRRSPDSVKALLDAGASTIGVTVPSGYDEVDTLLRENAP